MKLLKMYNVKIYIIFFNENMKTAISQHDYSQNDQVACKNNDPIKPLSMVNTIHNNTV